MKEKKRAKETAFLATRSSSRNDLDDELHSSDEASSSPTSAQSRPAAYANVGEL